MFAAKEEPVGSSFVFPYKPDCSYSIGGGVGVGVGLGIVSVVGDGSGFTGADGVELLGYVERCGVLGRATSVPAAVFMAARKVCAD